MIRTRLRVVAVAVCLGLGVAAACAARNRPPVPDFTQGDTRTDTQKKQHDWNLGPTGARGWMWAASLETTDARQILITQVDAGSPADGLLEPGDVILGLSGRPFATDARKAFGRAVTQAETPR
ncbi:MAG: DUF6288 domain-containing protein, partial [Planctomycetota bacterium]|nr:DUF6288 domain-containing protein [Planctomycetota bacterium]